MRLQEQEISAPVRDFVTPVETVVRVDQTIADALQLLRTRRIEQKVVYFYAVDADNRLQGVVSTRALLLSGPASKIGDGQSVATDLHLQTGSPPSCTVWRKARAFSRAAERVHAG